jgi:hypothetical protein
VLPRHSEKITGIALVTEGLSGNSQIGHSLTGGLQRLSVLDILKSCEVEKTGAQGIDKSRRYFIKWGIDWRGGSTVYAPVGLLRL